MRSPRPRWALVAVLAVGACHPQPRPVQHPAPHHHHHATHTAKAAPSARSCLATYLDLTFKGRHERAYGYLSSADRSHLSRGAYVSQENANDRVREQMRALGPVSYHIAGVKEHGDDASALVTVKTGLGTDRVRFVLHRERAHWSVVYAQSWASE
jgi:hypothetical protein